MKRKKINGKDMRPSYFCLHVLNGRTLIPKTCIHDYDCAKCAFDQWLDETEAEELFHVKAA